MLKDGYDIVRKALIFVGIYRSRKTWVYNSANRWTVNTQSHLFETSWKSMVIRLQLSAYGPWVGPHSACGCLSTVSVHGLCSLSGKTPYRQISLSLVAARLDVILIEALWNLTLLPRCLSSSERLEKSNPESRGFETSRDFAVGRPSA